MKSVLIVGAGPAGLVAAKTLLQHGEGHKFKVSVYEAKDRVGGMWAAGEDEEGDKCSPDMRTNLSRLTVTFSDFPYREHPDPRMIPMFQKAFKLGEYLQSYAMMYISDGVIVCNRKVVSANYTHQEQGGLWKVVSAAFDGNTYVGQEYQESFDYLIVASGFFDKPRRSFSEKPTPNAWDDSGAKVIHSSEFRELEPLVNSGLNKRRVKQGNKTVLWRDPHVVVVVGGSISGCEAAASAAFQISDAKASPDLRNLRLANSVVYHVFNRPFYSLPRYLPVNPYHAATERHNVAPTFLPLDLLMYNLSRRGDDAIHASNGPMSADKAQKAHGFIQGLIGGDQQHLGRSELVHTPVAIDLPPLIGISDTYAAFVRSGIIVPVLGYADSVAQDSSRDHLYLTIDMKPREAGAAVLCAAEEKVKISNAHTVIEATGYQAHLDYLTNSVKRELEYDPDCPRMPFLLQRGSIFSDKVPAIAFIGFYEGPFWGIMELQARLVAQKWAPLDGSHPPAFNYDAAETRNTREAMKKRDLDVPQFWMGDYVGMMEELARSTGMERNDNGFDGQNGPVYPGRYTDVPDNVQKLLLQSQTESKFVAAAVFNGLQGAWRMRRDITSDGPHSTIGTFHGIAYFHPRTPTDSDFAAEYLNIEECLWTSDAGLESPETPRDVYRYNEMTDTLSSYNVDRYSGKNPKTTGDHFITWTFKHPGEDGVGWLATGVHHGRKHTCHAIAEFQFKGANLEAFHIKYRANVECTDVQYMEEAWYEQYVTPPERDISKDLQSAPGSAL
ncbi:hypothetical protein BDV95DRAFT_602174 [Massariosphaeria phaeospora]|uniref:Uncharacterized protein n=1 Tax=Massariosphaeria phaeospora TaxID=100035 RepID=A0A7C8ME53_9PLEO|nr:hypothetical protein BDV95DRAFT_602174 [Massariosphaeria phaeospora]